VLEGWMIADGTVLGSARRPAAGWRSTLPRRLDAVGGELLWLEPSPPLLLGRAGAPVALVWIGEDGRAREVDVVRSAGVRLRRGRILAVGPASLFERHGVGVGDEVSFRTTP
jgi:hypothetical protein